MSQAISAGGASHSPLDVLADPGSVAAILWGGRRLIAGAMLSALVIAGLYLMVTPRTYQATAKLLVVEQGGSPLGSPSSAMARLVEGAEDSIPTHMAMASSPVVIRRAVEQVGLNNLPSLGPPGNVESAVRLVSEGITVARPDRQARIIQINYRSTSREEAERVVTAVVDSYQSFLDEVYARGNNQVVSLMTKAREDLNRELKELEQRYLEFHQKIQQTGIDANGRSFVAQRIDEWNRASRDTMLRAVQLKSQLELGRELAQSGVGLWSIAYAMDQVAAQGSTGGNSLASRVQANGLSAPADYLRQLATEQQKMSETLGPQSTKVKEIQEQIDQAQIHSRRTRGKLEQAEITELLSSVSKSLESLESMRTEIQKNFDRDLEQAKKAEIDQLAENNLKNELERHRTLFNTVVDQLKQARLVGDYAGTRAQVLEPPNTLPKAVHPRTSLTAMLGLAAGGFLGIALAIGAELVAPRIRSLGEMRRVLRQPVLGQLPFVPESQLPPSAMLARICQEMPRSPSAEAYRLVRANLELARRGRDTRVVLVTSPQPGCGRTTVSANLAVALTQAGRKVVLIDANLRDPSIHGVFSVARERGLVQLLRELLPVNRVIQASGLPGLDLIASGPEVTNPAELLSSASLKRVLDDLRSNYDAVIIDGPPLLGFADGSILSAAAEEVVLVVRLGETRRTDATRAIEMLEGIGTPILGAIVNSDRNQPTPLRASALVAAFRDVTSSEVAPDLSSTALIPFDPQVGYSATPDAYWQRGGHDGNSGTSSWPGASLTGGHS